MPNHSHTSSARRNQISSLPAGLGQLVNLQWLYLERNQLMNLPAELGKLTKLRQLIVNENQLGSLPAEIGQLHAESGHAATVPPSRVCRVGRSAGGQP